MAYPIVRIIHNRKRTSRPSAVEIVVSYQRKRITLSTGVSCLPSEYKNGKVIKRMDADECNKIIRSFYKRIVTEVSEMYDSGRFSLKELKASVSNQVQDLELPLEWIAMKIEIRDVSEETKVRHRQMLADLKKSGLFHTWSDFSVDNILRWDQHIKTHVRKQSTAHGYHKRLKPYLREAVARGFLDHSPYEFIKVDKGEKDTVTYLTDEERDAIEKVDLRGYLDKCRDVFIFCCYTGLAYIDVYALTADSIVDVDGRKMIDAERGKNGQRFLAPLPAKALEILEKYDWKLPVYTNQKMNVYLKAIAAAAGVKKNVTFHMARHTFATWALSQGVSIHIVAKTLGHTSVSTTEIYAKTLAKDVKEATSILYGGGNNNNNNNNNKTKEGMRRYEINMRLDNGDELRVKVVAHNQAEAIDRIADNTEAVNFIGEHDIESTEIKYIGEVEPVQEDRFLLQDSIERKGWKVAADTKNNITIIFEAGNFNETAKITSLEDETNPLKLATAIRELSEWLAINHKDLV